MFATVADHSEWIEDSSMEEFDDKQAKIEALRQHFTPLLGRQLSSFETAQLKTDGEWDHWFDLPIRLYFDHDFLVSIAWSYFDKLFLCSNKTLNFSVSGSEVRWVFDDVEAIRPALSGKLISVKLGLGDLNIDGRQVEIWSRLVLEQDNGWLEVFNGLDENAFLFHEKKPEGEFVSCC